MWEIEMDQQAKEETTGLKLSFALRDLAGIEEIGKAIRVREIIENLIDERIKDALFKYDLSPLFINGVNIGTLTDVIISKSKKNDSWKNGIPWESIKGNWVAMDEDGEWKTFDTEPQEYYAMWLSQEEHSWSIGGVIMPDPPSWKESKVKRPENIKGI